MNSFDEVSIRCFNLGRRSRLSDIQDRVIRLIAHRHPWGRNRLASVMAARRFLEATCVARSERLANRLRKSLSASSVPIQMMSMDRFFNVAAIRSAAALSLLCPSVTITTAASSRNFPARMRPARGPVPSSLCRYRHLSFGTVVGRIAVNS